MHYIKAEAVLPEELIAAIQQYADGVTLYIPRKEGTRRAWGCATSYRRELEGRNAAICREHAQGSSVPELAERYHLSTKSIGRILRKENI